MIRFLAAGLVCALSVGVANAEERVEIVHEGVRYQVPASTWEQIHPRLVRVGTGPVQPASWPQTIERTLRSPWTTTAAFGAALAVLCVVQFVVKPWRRRRKLLEALKLIDRDGSEDLEKAESLLTNVLTLGLRRADVAEGRFALAYVRARLKRYAEAEATLTDLKASGDRGGSVAYLELWTATRREDYERVEEIYEKHQSDLRCFDQAKLMVSMAYLKRAQRHWENKQVAIAAQYFQKIREIGVLTDALPEHVEDHHLVLGVQELFERNLEQARKHFDEAVSSEGAEERTKARGRIGLLLCDWHAHPDSRWEIDEHLVPLIDALMALRDGGSSTLANALCSHCGSEHTIRADDESRRVICTECGRGFTVTNVQELPEEDPGADPEEGAADRQPLLNDDDVLARDTLVWHLATLLHVWLDTAEAQPLDPSQLEELHRRADRVREIDGLNSHAPLVEGLIVYYFGFEDVELASRGIALLERAIELGVNLPEVHSLIQGQQRLEERRANAARILVQQIGEYLTNPQIPDEIRSEVREGLRPYAKRFEAELGSLEILPADPDNAPTPGDMQRRLDGLTRRLEAFLTHTREIEDDEREILDAQKEELASAGESLERQARDFERTEGKIITLVGQMLLKEEEVGENDDVAVRQEESQTPPAR